MFISTTGFSLSMGRNLSPPRQACGVFSLSAFPIGVEHPFVPINSLQKKVFIEQIINQFKRQIQKKHRLMGSYKYCSKI